jgi:DNA polymerase (family 10)
VSALPLPGNEDVAQQLDLLGDLLEIEGEQSFRIAAYRRAAIRVRETPTSIAQLALDGKAKELSGIGKTIEEKIVQIVEKGEIEALTKRKALIPQDVVLFTKLPGLGPKTARKIWQELGVTTVEELRAAAEGEQLRTLAGVGPKLEASVIKALDALGEAGPAEERRALLGDGLPAALSVVEELRSHPAVVRVSEAGSVRRRRETFKDVDVIATATDPAELIAHFVGLPWVLEVVAQGETKATVVSKEGLRFDLRVVQPECFGNLLQHFTGSKEHNIRLREDAQRRGLSISEYGVKVEATGEVVTHADEEGVYAYLGYAYVPPELREGAGELEAARLAPDGSHRLPELVPYGSLHGELHCHSTWSDGRATLEEMARAAAARGYEYMAICDHSQRLRDGRLQQQADEVAAVNALLAGEGQALRVLRGVEVNIRVDGSLDLTDEELGGLDWVVASLHASFEKSPTERVLAAMESPHVDCIGHLTTRLINRRPPAPLDVERVVAGAAATGTFLEINGQPDRLDLRDVHARLAGEAGVGIVCNSDAHATAGLAYADLALAVARRAWLTAPQVVNTLSWDALRARMKG